MALTHCIGIVNMLYCTIFLVIIGTKVILFVTIERFILLRLFLLKNTVRKILMRYTKCWGSNRGITQPRRTFFLSLSLSFFSFFLSFDFLSFFSCRPSEKQRSVNVFRITVRSKLSEPKTMCPLNTNDYVSNERTFLFSSTLPSLLPSFFFSFFSSFFFPSFFSSFFFPSFFASALSFLSCARM